MIQTRFWNWLTIIILLLSFETANATEFEKLGSAVKKVLKPRKGEKVYQKKEKNYWVFYTKQSGKRSRGKKTSHVKRMAFVEKGIYQPNCTHTWVIGLDGKHYAVSDIRVVEMSCHHAFPTQKPSYTKQYKGKSPRDAKKLKEQIVTIAKATGSSDLMTEAVEKVLKIVKKVSKTL